MLNLVTLGEQQTSIQCSILANLEYVKFFKIKFGKCIDKSERKLDWVNNIVCI